MSDQITDAQVSEILPLLEEAARASQRTVDRFVPPRTGIIEQVAARRHQFVLGRRGVGKSTLLHTVQAHALKDGATVAFIDLETLRGIPYPDVLIQLLSELIDALGEHLSRASRTSKPWSRGASRRARRRAKKLGKQ